MFFCYNAFVCLAILLGNWDISGRPESFCSYTLERQLKTEILLNCYYVTNMDRALFRPLAELGILTPSIVAIQRPCSNQAISLLRVPANLADITSTYGCTVTAQLEHDL